MTEAKILNCLLVTLVILTTTMFFWTINTIQSAGQIKALTTVSAFGA